ncbi:MAG TPA: hypothetical protein P5084_12010, partial [Paludibacter sp.]|nr:hypothetical protein [Paludibacter sp.]
AMKRKITISDKLITIAGRVLEKPDRTFNPIPATLYAGTGNQNYGTTIGVGVGVPPVIGLGAGSGNAFYQVVLQKDWITQLSEDEPDGITTPKTSNKGYSLRITDGAMKVENGDWSTLKYEGWMNTNTGKADDIAKDVSKTKFEVLGAVSASSDNLAVTGVNTPFGSMSQTFDFKKKELVGTLTLKSEVLLGTVRLHSGTIETCFGAEGFYVAGGCYAFIPAGFMTGDYNMGFMAGTYKLTDHLWNVTNSYIDPSVVNKCYPKAVDNQLSGFYFAFNREIINKSFEKNYILASGYVKAIGLIGGDFYINGGSNWKIGGDGYVHVNAAAGLSAITGTSISGSINGHGQIGFTVLPEFSFVAGVKLGFTAYIKQELGLTTLEESVSVGCGASGSTNDGFKFFLGDADKDVIICP